MGRDVTPRRGMRSLPRLSFSVSKWYIKVYSEASVCGLEESKGTFAVVVSKIGIVA